MSDSIAMCVSGDARPKDPFSLADYARLPQAGHLSPEAVYRATVSRWLNKHANGEA